MKILFATDQYAPTPGGISVVVHRLSHELAKKGHTVAILAPSQSWKFYIEIEGDVTIYRVQSFLLHKLKKVRYAPAFLYQKKITRIIRSFQPDIIHIETPDAIATAAYEEAVRLHIPVIGTCHIMPQNISGALPFLPSQMQKFVGNLYMKQLANLFNKIDFATAPTMTGIAILKANGVTIPMQVLSNGIDTNAFYPASVDIQKHLQEKIKLPEKVPVILYVGRLDKEKRVEILVKALVKLSSGKIAFHCVIAGTGAQHEILETLVQKLNLTQHVTFLGMLDEESLRSLYTLATVFVMPSTAELQSLVTMEAMAIGKPVIGAKAGALPYLIKDGENGYLFAPDNVTDLAEKIATIITNRTLQQKMGNMSQKIIQEHDIHVVVQKLEDVYKKVIAEHSTYPMQFLPAENSRVPL